jgi:hypothetical protein
VWLLARCLDLLGEHERTIGESGSGRAGLGTVLDVLERAAARVGADPHPRVWELFDEARAEVVAILVVRDSAVTHGLRCGSVNLLGERVVSFGISTDAYMLAWTGVYERAKRRAEVALGISACDSYGDICVFEEERRRRSPAVFDTYDKGHKRMQIGAVIRRAARELATIAGGSMDEAERDECTQEELAAMGLADVMDDFDIGDDDLGQTAPDLVEHSLLLGQVALIGSSATSFTNKTCHSTQELVDAEDSDNPFANIRRRFFPDAPSLDLEDSGSDDSSGSDVDSLDWEAEAYEY